MPGFARRAEDLVVRDGRRPGRSSDPTSAGSPRPLGHVDQDGRRDARHRAPRGRRPARSPWTSVRGKPSRITPSAASARPSRSSRSRTTISSGTSCPASMKRRASMPSGVPSRTAARKRSPVATIGMPQVCCKRWHLRALPGAWGAEKDHHVHRMKPSYWRIRSWASSCFIVSTTTETTIRRLGPAQRKILGSPAGSRPINGGGPRRRPGRWRRRR